MEALRVCKCCGKEAWKESELEFFGSDNTICLYCKAEREYLKRNPNKSKEDYALYRQNKSGSFLRKCKYCGIEAHTKQELVHFIGNKDAKYGHKNVCVSCNHIRLFSKKEDFDKDKYLGERRTKKALQKQGIIKVCRCCGFTIYKEEDKNLFHKHTKLCKVCYNLKDTIYKRRRYKYSTPPWTTLEHILQIRELKNICDELNVSISNIKDKYTLDHIYPLQHPALCGLNIVHNLQIITQSENSTKNNKLGYQGQDNLTELAKEIPSRLSREKLFLLLGSNKTYEEFLVWEKETFKGYIE